MLYSKGADIMPKQSKIGKPTVITSEDYKIIRAWFLAKSDRRRSREDHQKYVKRKHTMRKTLCFFSNHDLMSVGEEDKVFLRAKSKQREKGQLNKGGNMNNGG